MLFLVLGLILLLATFAAEELIGQATNDIERYARKRVTLGDVLKCTDTGMHAHKRTRIVEIY